MLHNDEKDKAGSNILVVDDNRQLLNAISLRLTEMGCRCTTCANASEALIQFSTGSFDLVITDMTMPGIDGLGVIGMIRSQSELPILVLTGHSGEYGRLISQYKNITLVRKPLGPQALITCVRSAVSGGLEAGALSVSP